MYGTSVRIHTVLNTNHLLTACSRVPVPAVAILASPLLPALRHRKGSGLLHNRHQQPLTSHTSSAAVVDTGLKNGLADEDHLATAQPLVPLLQQPIDNQYHDLGSMRLCACFAVPTIG